MPIKRLCNQCKLKDAEGIYQVSDYFWICENCERVRKQHYRNWNTIIDWDNKPTIDSLDEALNYFNWLQRGRQFASIYKHSTIHGYKGQIAHVVEIIWKGLDPLQSPWTRYFYYFICYNRDYLSGRAAEHFFERPSKSYIQTNWQSVHSKIISDALQTEGAGVRIVIIMKNKDIHYVDPAVIRTWANEYECEHILPRETEPTCSIPVTKLETNDPFYRSRTKQLGIGRPLQESNK